MTSPIHEASARQHSGEPFSGLGANDARRDRPHNQDLAKVDGEIARLVDRSTQELRRAWQRLYHTGSPLGLSRDLIIRGLADKLQQRAHGGPSRALQRHLRILAGEFENGAVGLVEDSWARRGGMDDCIEVYGNGGVTYADLHMGNALPTYSESGYGYAVEKAPTTQGWTYPVFEELWNYGFPQEMRHFARCVRGKEEPIATGEVGRLVQEVLCAAYQSARLGCKVRLPFRAQRVKKPIDLWWAAPAGQ